ncbi:MAG TPA: hypothetical protein VLX89_09780 [Actinomycetota bacterium]|nr:hypothetical protein [Actinomycetota bacterium]
MRNATLIPADGRLGAPDRAARATPSPLLRVAFVLAAAIAIAMVAASIVGLTVHGLYADSAWGREALRGGDLVSLLIAAPVLIAALVLAVRGSMRAQLVVIGMLAYTLYDYAYYTFGAAFNAAFLLHIALFSLSVFALACAIPGVDAVAVRDLLRSRGAARWVGGMLVVVGVLQGALWIFVVLRFAVTGELLHDIPVAGQHLVFALDLALLVPSLILAGVLLILGKPMGYVLGAAMAVMGAAYQLNLMAAGAFQANADVAGTTAFPPEGILLTTLFVAAAVALLRPRRAQTRG